MAAVLFIAPADLGETVLATGALAHLLGDHGEAVVVCGAQAACLFRALPGLHSIHVLGKGFSVFSTWWEVINAPPVKECRVDASLDAHGGWVGDLFGILKLRSSQRPQRIPRHKTEEWAELVGAERPLGPRLWLDTEARDAAARVGGDATQLLVIAPGGANEAKRWPAERFSAVARRLVSGPMANARVLVVSAAARDGDVAAEIVSSLAADGISARDVGGDLDLLGAAALMERATLCIGNDNALTHIAAAMTAPTLTLFGPTDERVRAPYGPRTRTLRGRSLEELASMPGLDAGAAMEEVSIDAVENAALELLRAGGLR